jgi:hypothetical protein
MAERACWMQGSEAVTNAAGVFRARPPGAQY